MPGSRQTSPPRQWSSSPLPRGSRRRCSRNEPGLAAQWDWEGEQARRPWVAGWSGSLSMACP
eukprot:8983582-Alexandrium_andersonii.AAC.1